MMADAKRMFFIPQLYIVLCNALFSNCLTNHHIRVVSFEVEDFVELSLFIARTAHLASYVLLCVQSAYFKARS